MDLIPDQHKSWHLKVTVDSFEPNSLGYLGHIKIPEYIADAVFCNNARRVSMSINEMTSFPAGIMKSKEFFFILLSKNALNKFGISIGQTINISIESDNSKYGLPLPDEFHEIFLYDDEAKGYFDNLTPGNRRNLIYIIDKIKNQNLRVDKSLIIFEHLKANKGKLDFKMLQTAFRQGLH